METKLLTERERHVLLMRGFDLEHEYIANRLYVCPDTVYLDVKKIYRKLRAKKLSKALLLCILLKEISIEDIEYIFRLLPN